MVATTKKMQLLIRVQTGHRQSKNRANKQYLAAAAAGGIHDWIHLVVGTDWQKKLPSLKQPFQNHSFVFSFGERNIKRSLPFQEIILIKKGTLKNTGFYPILFPF